MTITSISLEGLGSGAYPETRSLAYISVTYNSQVYKWQVYVPNTVTDLNQFLQDSSASIQAQIDAKEAVWQALEPKTKTVLDPLTGEPTLVAIPKEEVVRADVPDYFAQRRDAYPSIGDQLDAFWKGPNSADYTQMVSKIQAVKTQFPKPGE